MEKLVYTGSKNAPGVYQWIINNIPYHERYFELFAGTAAIYYKKKPADVSFLSDLNPKIEQYHIARSKSSMIFHRQNALDMLDHPIINIGKSGTIDFVYLDPPYVQTARRQGRSYYLHEMMEENEHIQLLNRIIQLKCYVMISTKSNSLYDEMLKSWRKEEFYTADRQGGYYEQIYMNYEPPEYLHQYDFLGQNCTDRQRIQRKAHRFTKKIQQLPVYERHLLIQKLLTINSQDVGRFLQQHFRQ